MLVKMWSFFFLASVSAPDKFNFNEDLFALKPNLLLVGSDNRIRQFVFTMELNFEVAKELMSIIFKHIDNMFVIVRLLYTEITVLLPIRCQQFLNAWRLD